MRESADEPRGITALLGPTNTGKTHQALQRMLEHRTGMIGLPLRLLAREVYDRLTTQVGERDVALVTGEEKRVPARPRFFVCTVEAMPIEHEVDFIAIDEIQLCSHAERGHVFTERLLHARGRQETWLLGSSTIRPLLERFVPTARIVSRPRFSALRGSPSVTLSRLAPRTAVVAFSTDRVYEIAAQLRHRRGGAAIVLGALSPRTRNAQVALYQSGEVDYMVATDAIGMGLNLSIDHIAFAGKSKFDGREARPLEIAELAQIAGRAGRYLNPGTFGTLLPTPEFSAGVVRAIEAHQFPPDTHLVWRNADLDFSSPDSLLQSLRLAPKRKGLRLITSATDQSALSNLVADMDVRQYLGHQESIELLWDVCKIPDYRQLWFELHVQFLRQVFLQLAGPKAQIDSDFIAKRLRSIDDIRGDIQTLMDRIADIRTWTYVATHPRWISNSQTLKEQTMAIEDRLSDALHERLVMQFVERTRSIRVPSQPPRSSFTNRNASPFAWLIDQLSPQIATTNVDQTNEWLEQAISASHEQLTVDSQGSISHNGQRIAQFEAGPDLLHPNIRLAVPVDLGPGIRSRLLRRLLAFGRDLAESITSPLRARAASQLTPAGRGIVYQLEQNLGTIHVEQAQQQLNVLAHRDRELLTSFGVQMGEQLIYLRHSLGPQAIAQRAALASVRESLKPLCADVALGAPSIDLNGAEQSPGIICLGYYPMGPLAIRADHYNKVWRELIRLDGSRCVRFPQHLAQRLQCSHEQFHSVLRHWGYRPLSPGRFTNRTFQRGARTDQRSGQSSDGTRRSGCARLARNSSE
jgi:ATP-dependent RNA helicase SUPV3L1/SUV3